MRAIRAASAALLGVAALALTAPVPRRRRPHGNITPFGFTVSPSTVAPGGTVTLALSDCGRPATVSSGVFDTVTVPTGRSVTATVDGDARPGARYQVTFTCGGQSGTTGLAIARGREPAAHRQRRLGARRRPGRTRRQHRRIEHRRDRRWYRAGGGSRHRDRVRRAPSGRAAVGTDGHTRHHDRRPES